MNKIGIYFKSIIVPVIIGGIVGIIISPFIDYNNLNKPILSPPSILFPIIWTILYVLMGISYGILKSKNLNNNEVNKNYYLQLGINALWSVFFFIFKLRLFSFFWLLVLIIAVIKMIIEFYKQDKISGILQIPYLLWIIFAAYLNLGVYILNSK